MLILHILKNILVNYLSVKHPIIKYRVSILVVIAAITIFMGFQAKKVALDYELAQMLPEKDTAFIEYNRFKSIFGEDAKLILLGFRDKSILELDNFKALQQLSNDIGAIRVKGDDNEDPESSVLSLGNIHVLAKDEENQKLNLQELFKYPVQTQAELDSLLAIAKEQIFYKDLLFKETDDSFVTILTITLRNDLVNSKSRIAFVHDVYELGEQFHKQTGINVHYSGLPFIRTHVMATVRGELSLFIALAALVLAVILFLFFRSYRVVMISLLIVGVSVIWVFGSIALFGFKITILTGLIPPLIIVIGIPNSIFLINKYHQECHKKGNKWKALKQTISKIGWVIFLSNLTTAAGFATFILTSSAILVEFGVIAAINIFGLFFLSITIFPILLSFQKMPTDRHLNHLKNKPLQKIIKWLVLSSIKNRRWVYSASFLLVLISVIGISRIKTEGTVVDDIPHDDDVYVDLLFFEEQFNGVLPFEIVIDTKEEGGVFGNGAKTLYKMRRLEKILMRDTLFTPYFSKPVSILDGVRYLYQAHRGGDPKYNLLPSPSQLNKLKKYVNEDEGDNSVFNSFVDSNRQVTRMSLKMANVTTDQIDHIQDSLRVKVDNIFETNDYNVSFTGTSVVFLKGTYFLIRNLFVSLAIAIVLISLFIASMFKSFRMVFISLIPNLIPLLFTAGIMGYFGIPIKPSTILVFSIAFGISVDDSIHFLAKYRQELKHHKGRIKHSVVVAIKESGVSMIYTSIVLFFGFAIFTASSFGGTVALGLLVSLTLLVAMITNLLLLPALLLSLEKMKRKELKGKKRK